MVTIELNGHGKEEVKQAFLHAFAQVIFRGMGLTPSDEELTRAIQLFESELDYSEEGENLVFGSDDPDMDFTLQDCAFSLAWSLYSKNSYNDSFGADEESALASAGKKLIEKFPGLIFRSDMYIDTEWSMTKEVVSTVDGEIVSEIVEC